MEKDQASPRNTFDPHSPPTNGTEPWDDSNSFPSGEYTAGDSNQAPPNLESRQHSSNHEPFTVGEASDAAPAIEASAELPNFTYLHVTKSIMGTKDGGEVRPPDSLKVIRTSKRFNLTCHCPQRDLQPFVSTTVYPGQFMTSMNVLLPVETFGKPIARVIDDSTVEISLYLKTVKAPAGDRVAGLCIRLSPFRFILLNLEASSRSTKMWLSSSSSASVSSSPEDISASPPSPTPSRRSLAPLPREENGSPSKIPRCSSQPLARTSPYSSPMKRSGDSHSARFALERVNLNEEDLKENNTRAHFNHQPQSLSVDRVLVVTDRSSRER